MNAEGGSQEALERSARRLREIATALGKETTSDSDAVALAREAAEIAAEVGAVATAAAREASETAD